MTPPIKSPNCPTTSVASTYPSYLKITRSCKKAHKNKSVIRTEATNMTLMSIGVFPSIMRINRKCPLNLDLNFLKRIILFTKMLLSNAMMLCSQNNLSYMISYVRFIRLSL